MHFKNDQVWGSHDGNVKAPPTNTINPDLTAWFQPGEKKIEYAKPRTKGRGVSYGKIMLTTVTVTQRLLSRRSSRTPHCMQEDPECNEPVV